MIELLRRAPLLSGLGQEQLERVAANAVPVHLDEGQWLFSQGDPSRRFYFLHQGQIRLFRLSPEGTEKIIEIVSPGHERKDTLDIFLLLQRHRVPYYWIIWPEDRVLIAHQLDGAGYRVIATLSGETTARVPPFDAIALDLAYILG